MSKNSSQHDQPDQSTSLSTEERRTIAPDLIVDGGMAWEKYKLPIMAGIMLLVLALVGSEIYQGNLARKASAASAQLNGAKTDAEYQTVIDSYPGSQAAANAYLLLGRAKFDAKDYAGAAQVWQTLVTNFPQHPLAPSALTGVAGALEAQGKPDEARNTYQRIATAYPKSYTAPLARLGEAEILLSQRKLDDAKHVYEDLISTSEKGFAGRIAEQELKTINALPPVGSGPVPLPTAAPASSPADSATMPAVPAATPAEAPAVSPVPTPADVPSATAVPVVPSNTPVATP